MEFGDEDAEFNAAIAASLALEEQSRQLRESAYHMRTDVQRSERDDVPSKTTRNHDEYRRKQPNLHHTALAHDNEGNFVADIDLFPLQDWIDGFTSDIAYQLQDRYGVAVAVRRCVFSVSSPIKEMVEEVMQLLTRIIQEPEQFSELLPMMRRSVSVPKPVRKL
jgi:hypothetical protein